jgi:hypothetical protein
MFGLCKVVVNMMPNDSHHDDGNSYRISITLETNFNRIQEVTIGLALLFFSIVGNKVWYIGLVYQ